MSKAFYTVFILLLNFKAYGWNSLGHRLVAQIAYDHMTKQTRQLANCYNHTLNKVYKPLSFINAAPWLDTIRDKEMLKKHYIDLPFSWDGTKLIPPSKVNAISAIEEAEAAIQFGLKDDFEKGFNLRVLLHVVGDIHQPMHAVSQFSQAYPQGDKGGNLVRLAKNPLAANLHAYWDKGGGFLINKKSSNRLVKRKALAIERIWPCSPTNMELNPKIWAEESYQIAVHQAYLLKKGQKPDQNYQYLVKRISRQQIALAGCRLAAILNTLLVSPSSHC